MDKSRTPLKGSDSAPGAYPQLEFHLRAAISSGYNLKLPIFALKHGQLRVDFHGLQNLVMEFNRASGQSGYKTSEMYGVGIISLLQHKLIRLYRNQIERQLIEHLDEHLQAQWGQRDLSRLLEKFLEYLPTDALTASGLSAHKYLQGKSNLIPNRQIVLEEFLVHILALNNPAFSSYEISFREVFDERLQTPERLLEDMRQALAETPGFGADEHNLLDLLLAPARHAPTSIADQLAYIRSHWSTFLGVHLDDLLRGIDLFNEEQRFRGGGPGESMVPSYTGELLEGENYSEDSDWMPRVVMIARNTLVWLDQLSKKYGTSISRLDQIPMEELQTLSQQGFTVLWLIGLWKRSDISRTIKHWCGNPDAESSAYSLKEYVIDPLLGGQDALEALRRRAWECGIRLASDMVPNHTGLDAPWLKQHPEWYISAPEPPFPAYSFNGGNLSNDPEQGIYLEDHYFDRSDAAVVFKQVDHRNGQTRYIYHGNDGTSMPWNDTAQLNYLNPELREEVIQTILDVARQFKVIRFDAAMTLAKRHIQRLWFPEPGAGGDIPSRSHYAMSGSDFNAAIPAEFWREVVDRVAREVPDTLLLAEAFWMMEGYFVRTLGMHRVYNSAFMNMLKMEENSKFFDMITQTLAFDPRILQRFVNFLSNPDEDTAIAQFGKGDKYFGATILMVTLPGLPMFAHAQIEGFEEKYGMEYRRAYWDEQVDEHLLARHRREIFPLMKKRYLFAGANSFRLFPFHNADGHKVDSVFAYANRSGTERSLILVNNAYEATSGWIKLAVPVNTNPGAPQPELVSDDLVSALSFDVDESYYVIYQEQMSRLWYIRSVKAIRDQGLYVELNGYESQIYLNWQLVSDTQSTPWSDVHTDLGGKGIWDFAPLFRSMELEPVKQLFSKFLKFMVQNEGSPDEHEFMQRFAPLFESMLDIDNISIMMEEIQEFAGNFRATLKAFVQRSDLTASPTLIQFMSIISLARQLAVAHPDAEFSLIRTYELGDHLNAAFNLDQADDIPGLVAALEHADKALALIERDPAKFFQSLLTRESMRRYLLVHEADEIIWFNRERMETFLNYLHDIFFQQVDEKRLQRLRQALKKSEYQLQTFLELL